MHAGFGYFQREVGYTRTRLGRHPGPAAKPTASDERQHAIADALTRRAIGRTRAAGGGPIGHETGTEAAQGIINALYQPGNIHSELVFHLARPEDSNPRPAA